MNHFAESFHTDIKQNSKFEKLLPGFLVPFSRLARLDRPIGTWLLLLPCLWSLFLASPSLPSLFHLFLFTLGAIVMRGAGCTYNDLIDFDLDEKVERTGYRPIPSGEVSKLHALMFLIFQLSIGFVILMQLPGLTIALGCLSLLLVFTYPWMKRVTYWPQAFLGLTFNWGVLMGWATVQESLSFTPLFLYLGGIMWTLVYDTIYAHQDREDDLNIGIKSTALKFGIKTKRYLSLFSLFALIMFALAGWWESLNWVYYVGLGLVGLHLTWQIVSLNIDNPQDCLQKFKSNQWLGWILVLAIVGGRFL